MMAVALTGAVEPPRGGTLTVGVPYDIDTLNVYATAELGDVELVVNNAGIGRPAAPLPGA